MEYDKRADRDSDAPGKGLAGRRAASRRWGNWLGNAHQSTKNYSPPWRRSSRAAGIQRTNHYRMKRYSARWKTVPKSCQLNISQKSGTAIPWSAGGRRADSQRDYVGPISQASINDFRKRPAPQRRTGVTWLRCTTQGAAQSLPGQSVEHTADSVVSAKCVLLAFTFSQVAHFGSYEACCRRGAA